MHFPPYLKPGNTIGLTCPAGFMEIEKVQSAINTLEHWGFKTKIGKTVGSNSKNYFSGTDDERLNDLQEMMDDKNIDAILCARGGYGTGRIIDRIDFKKLKKHPKWIIGYSDITVLHCHLLSNYKISSIHAPMAAAFNETENDHPNQYVQSLLNVITGKDSEYHDSSHPFNKKGKAKGRLVGGNLSLLAHLVGTSSDIETKNRILFIEDVGEYIYNVDRMMYQLKRSGKLKNLAALIVGKFTDMKDTERPFGQTAEEVIRDIIKEFDYPVCFNFPVSHEKENYALKIGAKYKLEIGEKVILRDH